jgi:hypothetical protein
VSTSLLLPLQSWPEALGWSLLLALGETSLLAFVVRGLFHRAGRPTAARRYRLAWSALWIGAALWAASLGAALHPVAMGETARRSLDVLIRLPALAGSHGSAAGSTPSVRGAADPALYGHITPVLAWVWLAVAAVLLVRLAGGWLLARRILARASHVTNERALEAFRALADRLRVRRVELRESAELDAPGTVSGSRPPSSSPPAWSTSCLPTPSRASPPTSWATSWGGTPRRPSPRPSSTPFSSSARERGGFRGARARHGSTGAVSRKLVQAEAPSGADGNPLCADDAGFEYSEGADLPIRDEPGRMATCCSGVWVEKCRPAPETSR